MEPFSWRFIAGQPRMWRGHQKPASGVSTAMAAQQLALVPAPALPTAVPGLEHASESWLENDTVFNILQDPQRHVFPPSWKSLHHLIMIGRVL